jgi:hypothetical protein
MGTSWIAYDWSKLDTPSKRSKHLVKLYDELYDQLDAMKRDIDEIEGAEYYFYEKLQMGLLNEICHLMHPIEAIAQNDEWPNMPPPPPLNWR